MDIELSVKKIDGCFIFNLKISLMLARQLASLYNAHLLESMYYLQSCTNSARVVKLVDTRDLKSLATVKRAYRFKSGLGHHQYAK